MKKTSLLRAKLETFIYGIRMGDNLLEYARQQNPWEERRAGYSHTAFINLTDGKTEMFVGAPVYNTWVKYSPLEARVDDQGIGLYKGNEKLCDIEFVKPPKWYSEEVSDGTPAGRLVQQHGKNQLATAVWSNCTLFLIKEECKFCAMGYNKNAMQFKKPEMLAEALGMAIDENPNYELVMNSGTPPTPDRGADLFAATANIIRKSGVPMAAELAPPVRKEYFKKMYDAGITGVMINLELYDEAMRQAICPGKFRLASQNRYFEAFEEALDVFGAGRVTSVLLAGLERKEMTIEGARKMINIGIIPEVLVFRGTNGTPLENYPPANPDDIEYINRVVAVELLRSGLNLDKALGCLKCGGCTPIAEYVQKKRDELNDNNGASPGND